MLKKLTTTIIIAVLLTGMFGSPVLAQSGDGNIVCDSDGNTTGLGNVVQPIVTLIITLAALIAIVGGAGFTMASAARPGEDEYVKNRNFSVLYGGGAILVLYGANALIGQIAPEGTNLEFDCVLP